jgi:UDP-N-acetylglucosamine kinase
MPKATAGASGAWVERAIDHAAEHGFNVLVEGTFRRPEVVVETAQKFKNSGFTVQVVVVAVPPEVSRASIAGRYVDDVIRTGHGRFTPLDAHQIAFNAIPATIRAVSASGSPVDRITVRSRETQLSGVTRRGSRSIRGALSVARAEWLRSPSGEGAADWLELASNSISFLERSFAEDADVRLLVRQLGHDREFIELTRDGSVAVRGHVNGTSDVTPHIRSRPPRH